MKIYGVALLFVLTLVLSNLLNTVRLDFSTEASVVPRTLDIPQTALPLYSEKGALSLPDRPVMIVFFGSWCKPCLLELPVLAELAKRKDIPFVGIAVRDTPKQLDALFKKTENPFDVVALDTDSDWTKGLRAWKIPRVYLTNGKGAAVYEISGVLNEEFYFQHVLTLIRELQK